MSAARKPVILWLWWYDRFDLVKPLLPVMEQSKNYFLFYRFKSQEQLGFELPGERLYWTDFSSPYSILKRVRPDKVVFMGIENLLTIALLSACRRKGIKTYYLAHGITSAYTTAFAGEQNTDTAIVDARYNQKNEVYRSRKTHSFQFYFRALLKASWLEKAFLIRFLLNSFRYSSIHERLYYTRSPFRLADQYIVFTRHLARLLTERDGVPDKMMKEVGVYTLDELFVKLAQEDTLPGKEPLYVLMIDQPIGAVPIEQQQEFWKSLASGWQQLGYILVVKLHPSNWSKPDPVNHDNIRWVRNEADITYLVKGASACLGYFSALLLPIIWYKPCGLFNPTNQSLIHEWEALGVVRVLPYKGFTLDQLKECLKPKSAANLEKYKRQFLLSIDGRGTGRLKGFIIDKCCE